MFRTLAIVCALATTTHASPHRTVVATTKIVTRTPLQSAAYSAMRYQALADLYAQRARDASFLAVCIHERTGPYGGSTQREASRQCNAMLADRTLADLKSGGAL